MKKVLLSLWMLCCATIAAWAGTGDGTSGNPFSGEWKLGDLVSKLNLSDNYLAYDFKLVELGSEYNTISVYDDIYKKWVAEGLSTWEVGADFIGDNPIEAYKGYCSLNPERESQTFIATNFVVQGSVRIYGHYSGKYIDDSSVYVDSIGKICVHNGQELRDAIIEHGKDHNAIIQLMNDIDMSGVKHITESDGSGCHFKAQLCGYYNKKFPNGEIATDEYGKPIVGKFAISKLDYFLFGECEDAKIEGIMLKDANLSSIAAYRSNLICHTATNTEFNDITIYNCRYDDEFIGKYFLDLIPVVGWAVEHWGIGSYAGQLATKMYDCKVKEVYIMGSSLYMRGSGVGNIAGYAKRTTFEDCYADAASTVYVDSETNAYAGGLVGECEDCTFTDCSNMSTVCGSEKADNVGGICGESRKCTFEHCYNGGVLSQVELKTWAAATAIEAHHLYSSIETIAGFHPIEVGKKVIRDFQILTTNTANTTNIELLLDRMAMVADFKMTEDFVSVIERYTNIAAVVYAAYSVSFNIIVAINDPDELGGISSAAYGCTFEQCMNGGRIFCLDDYAGGIVGRAGTEDGRKTIFNKCINIGYVQGNQQIGGIVGCLEDDGEILNCLNTSTIDSKERKDFGPIYGEKTDGTTVKNCFALTHDAKDHTDGLNGGNGVTSVSYRDVMSGLVACTLNKLTESNYFHQTVGKQPYPTFFCGDEIDDSKINKDIGSVYKVADLGGFVNAVLNQYADIELLNDIDFEGYFFSVYRKETPFRGSIDGKGHSLKNIRANVSDFAFDINGKYAMIGAAEGATFKNLSLDKCKMNFPGTAAGLVCESTGCKYENVHLVDSTTITAKWARVGGIVCKSNGDSLINCSVENDCVLAANLYPNGLYSEVGGMAFTAEDSKFIDCCNKGKITGQAGCVGGIVSDCNKCNIIRCVNYESATIEIETKDNDYDGFDHGAHGAGIAAFAVSSHFEECANYGKIIARNKETGGIVGYGKDVVIYNCLNSTPSGFLTFYEGDRVKSFGSIIGKAEDHSSVSNCAANKDGKYGMIGEWEDMQRTAGDNYMLGGLGDKAGQWEMAVTQTEFDNGKVCYWLNEDTDGPWRQNGSELTLNGDGSPVTLSDIVNEDKDYVFKIYTPEDLRNFAEYVNSGHQFADAILMNDINMAGEEFTPIGVKEDHKHFRGIIDGRGHTIDSLKVESNSPVGLIGAAHSHAEVHNVIIGKGSEFVNKGSVNDLGDEGAGGIIGRVADEWRWGPIHIKNCGSYANIKVNKHGGGIFGRINTAQTENNVVVYIANCFSMGTVTAHNGNSGLLCGYMKNQGDVSNCWSGGQLRTSQPNVKPFSTENNFGEWELLVGFDEGKMPITNCYVIDPEQNVDLWNKDHYQGGVNVVEESDDLANGKFAFLLNDSINDASKSHGWQQNLGTDAHPVPGNKGIYHARNINKEYGTICLPYALYSNDDIKYYDFRNSTIDNGEIKLRFVYTDKVKPGTPTLFYSKTMGDHTFIDDHKIEVDYDKYDFDLSIEVVDLGDGGWKMHSHPVEKVFEGEEAKTVYYVSNNVIRNAKKTTIAPYRAYFRGPNIDELQNSVGMAKVRIVFEEENGEETSIELVGDDLVPVLNGKAYSLFGTEVGEGYRGIVIKNGKKYNVR